MAVLQEYKKNLEEKLMLHMMSQIETTPEISQRALSSHLGIAIGLVNTYLKKCIRKGWIKMQQIPTKRYAYYLTAKGFVEKANLTIQYLSASFHFLYDAQHQMDEIYSQCIAKGWTKILLIGAGELAEIALLVARKVPLVPKVMEAEYAHSQEDFDCMIITDIRAPQKTFELLSTKVPENRILAPALLHISRGNALRKEA